MIIKNILKVPTYGHPLEHVHLSSVAAVEQGTTSQQLQVVVFNRGIGW